MSHSRRKLKSSEAMKGKILFAMLMLKLVSLGFTSLLLYNIAIPIVRGANQAPIAAGCQCSNAVELIIGEPLKVADRAECAAACEASTVCLAFEINKATSVCQLFKSGCVFVDSDTSLCFMKAGYAPPIRQSGVCSHVDSKGNDDTVVQRCRAYDSQAACEKDSNCFHTQGPTPIIDGKGCYCSNHESIATSSNSLTQGKTLEECHALCQTTD